VFVEPGVTAFGATKEVESPEGNSNRDEDNEVEDH
jgi:hypothetical protein